MLLPFFLDHIDATEESASPCDILIIKVLTQGHDTRVGIVGMQDDELFMLLGCCGHTGQQCYKYNKV
jgi:hypothetical protein